MLFFKGLLSTTIAANSGDVTSSVSTAAVCDLKQHYMVKFHTQVFTAYNMADQIEMQH